MYGNYDHVTATKLAEEKTKATGKNHTVFPAEDYKGNAIPGMFTLGVEIEGMSGDQFKEMLREKFMSGDRKIRSPVTPGVKGTHLK